MNTTSPTPPGWYPDRGQLRWWDGQAWTEHTAPVPPTVPPTAPAVPVAERVKITPGAIRGTSFGDRWIEVSAGRSERKALDKVLEARGKTGPKSLRVEDALIRPHRGDRVLVSIGGADVGELTESDVAGYRAVLDAVGAPIECSGIVLIDAEGHPGAHFKLYLPSADLLVPANALDLRVPTFYAHDRAGGITLAKRKADYALIEAATAAWWRGVQRSAWVVLTRDDDLIHAHLDGYALPDLQADRSETLRRVWDERRPGEQELQLEAIAYEVKAGRQLNLRYQF